jgi:hypothetical protein
MGAEESGPEDTISITLNNEYQRITCGSIIEGVIKVN